MLFPQPKVMKARQPTQASERHILSTTKIMIKMKFMIYYNKNIAARNLN